MYIVSFIIYRLSVPCLSDGSLQALKYLLFFSVVEGNHTNGSQRGLCPVLVSWKAGNIAFG